MHHNDSNISGAFHFFLFKYDNATMQNTTYENTFYRMIMFLIISSKNVLLIKNSIFCLDTQMKTCAIQLEYDHFFFTLFHGFFSLWKQL